MDARLILSQLPLIQSGIPSQGNGAAHSQLGLLTTVSPVINLSLRYLKAGLLQILLY